jgi:molybdenum-dependent DNA-binding transcriptional regulator ModE
MIAVTREDSIREMAMDIVRVRYFLAVCQHGSFTAAAKACGVSQPSVTTGVRRLEKAVGAQLFARSHPVRLTPLGAELRPLLQELQSAADRISAAVEATCSGKAQGLVEGAGVLGRATRAPEYDDDHEERVNEHPADPMEVPIGASDRWTDLFRRSCKAVESSEMAVRKFRQIWQQ